MLAFRSRARSALTLMALALVGLPVGVLGQGLTRNDRERGRTMLRQIEHEIEKSYYDSTLKGLSLADTAAVLDSLIQQATTLAEVLTTVARLPLVLQDSHTFFLPPSQRLKAEYGWEMLMVGDSCYVEQVKANSDAEHQGLSPGDLLLSVSGYALTRQNLWLLRHLFHVLRPQSALGVVVQSPAGVRHELSLAANVVASKNVYDLTGLNGEDIAQLVREEENADRERPNLLVEVGDVAVWRLPTFNIPLPEIRNQMKVVRRHRALVLDLRGNQGGSGEALRTLVGQLSPVDDSLGVSHERRRRTPLVAKGSGDAAFVGPLVVLVDSRSASASEILARAMQLAGRGIVLGDRTAGAVMGSQWRSFAIGAETMVFYGVAVTVADFVMSDGGRLEGVGVQPDTLILPTGADLAARRDPVLARALTIVGKPMDPAAAGALLQR